MNFVYVRPVSCASAPALWVASFGLDVHRVTLGEYRLILAAMALCWGDELDGTMAVGVVVPVDEAFDPVARIIEIGKRLGRIAVVVFEGLEQRLGERIVVAHLWARERRHDAEPLQSGQHGCALHGPAVVGVQGELLGVNAFSLCDVEHDVGGRRGRPFGASRRHHRTDP